MSRTIANTPFLRFALLGDAIASGATGLLMAAAAGPLSGLLGLPQALLFGAGLMLLPYAVFVAWIGRKPQVPTALVWAVIILNAVWVVDSFLLLLSGWVQPTGLGMAFVIAQAAVVALFAELQFIGLKRGARMVEAAA
jgi:hypothetical protein